MKIRKRNIQARCEIFWEIALSCVCNEDEISLEEKSKDKLLRLH